MQPETDQIVSQNKQHVSAQSSTRHGLLFVLSAPSGTGKDTVIHALKQQGLNFYVVPSMTTRPPRPGESEGNPYHFINQETFESMVNQGELLEYANVHGNWYGQPRKLIRENLSAGRDVLLKIDVKGAATIKSKVPNAIFIFLIPGSLDEADGSKGPRLYDWALIGTARADHQLLVRRSLAPDEKGELELAFFRCWSPRPVTLPELVAVAGARWGIEDCFAEAKNEAGLDHYQVRKYRAWYRHVTLSMLAHAFLAVAARATRPGTGPPPASGNAGSRPAEKGDLKPVDNASPRPGHMPRRHS